MSGAAVGRIGRWVVLGLTLAACNTFDPRSSDDPCCSGFGHQGAPGFGDFVGGSPPVPVMGLPPLPPQVLQVLQRSPAPDATDIDPASEILISFTLPLHAAAMDGATLFDPDGNPVPCFESVQGTTLRLKPITPLEPDTTYRVEVSMFIRTAGETTHLMVHPTQQRWTFTTRSPSEVIDLGAPLTRVAYAAGAHRGYGLDRANQKLVAIDFATRARAGEHTLPGSPDDLCVTPAGTRVFIVYRDNQFFTEHDATTLEQLRVIDWPATRHESIEVRPHVRCTDSQLLLVDGQWEPALWTFAFDASTPVDRTSSVHGIGDLVPTSDGDEFYYWWQLGWNVGNSGSDVRRVALADLSQVDTTELGYPRIERDPLDAPIFLDEARDRVITKNFVIDRLDLLQVEFEFPRGEVIYAVDLPRQRAASQSTVYSLETLMPIAPALSVRTADRFFDRDGVLYYVDPLKNRLIVQRF